MSKKQSSIEWLFVELLNTPKDKFEWKSIFEQAKAMHRKEIIDAIYQGRDTGDGEHYYNKTFGGLDNE